MAAALRGVLASSTSLPRPGEGGASAERDSASQRTFFSTSPLAMRDPTTPAAIALSNTFQVRRLCDSVAPGTSEKATQVVTAAVAAPTNRFRRKPHDATWNWL